MARPSCLVGQPVLSPLHYESQASPQSRLDPLHADISANTGAVVLRIDAGASIVLRETSEGFALDEGGLSIRECCMIHSSNELVHHPFSHHRRVVSHTHVSLEKGTYR